MTSSLFSRLTSSHRCHTVFTQQLDVELQLLSNAAALLANKDTLNVLKQTLHLYSIAALPMPVLLNSFC
jgi:hypothetical protein